MSECWFLPGKLSVLARNACVPFVTGKDQIRVNKIISEEYEALPEDSPRGLIGSDADSSNETMAGAGGWQQVDGDSSAGNNSA